MYSVSKSFTSTAIGLAVAEGRLKLTDKVVSFFPESLPDTVSPYLAQLDVDDLLKMSVGQAREPQEMRFSDDWIKTFLAAPVQYEPGTVFLYNSAGSFMLSAILQKATGEKLIDYLKPRLFEPLGIKDADWEVNPQGINVGGWGLRVKTEDMAKLGLLYLQKGNGEITGS
jgi:Beta-lactamase class C and other penicillin binding proteins